MRCTKRCVGGCVFGLGKGRFYISPGECSYATVPRFPTIGMGVVSLISKDIERTYYIRLARYIAFDSDSDYLSQSQFSGGLLS